MNGKKQIPEPTNRIKIYTSYITFVQIVQVVQLINLCGNPGTKQIYFRRTYMYIKILQQLDI